MIASDYSVGRGARYNEGSGGGTMTSDERLDRLSERIDALTQTVELIAAMHKDLERETAARFAETLQIINRLAQVA